MTIVSNSQLSVESGLDNVIDEEHGLDGLERGVGNDGLESGVEGASISLDHGQRKEVVESFARDTNIPVDTNKDAENLKLPSFEGLIVIPKNFQPMGAISEWDRGQCVYFGGVSRFFGIHG
ncbi:hypothetical protein LIER_37061 [Lithospermum erythrorhizon]|uniref:Uncharacterized protein n=1 Tax=Lithospermum erythrorhizon TaxID=34254 RepID=A0AAV3PIE5_LITER